MLLLLSGAGEALVPFEMLCVGKRLAAVAALQWAPLAPLATVNLLVPLQVLHTAEALATGTALIRPLTRVDSLVSLQVAQAAEAATTLRAPVGPLTRVHQLVTLQRARVREALAAEFAAVRLLTHLHTLMAFQVPGMTKRPTADRALKGPGLRGQWARVFRQVRVGVKTAAALWAEMQGVTALLA